MSASRWFGIGRFVILVVTGLLAPIVEVSAQDPVQAAFEDALAGRIRGIPELPPEGAWGEIINVTERWLVVQNHVGQQFPIAIEDIDEFLIRWPSNVEDISPGALVEAIGPTPGSNIVRAGHVDFFEGADRLLVAPTFREILPNVLGATALDPWYQPFQNPWDYGAQYQLHGWAFSIPHGPAGLPSRLHAVGSPINLLPLQLRVPGNNVATITADLNGRFTITQVTLGTARLTSKGDFAFLMPIEAKTRGLRVAQLVVYKTVSLRKFVPAAR